MAYSTIGSPATTLVHALRQLPIDQQALTLVGQNDVPDAYIAVQNLCDIESMRVSFAFMSEYRLHTAEKAHLVER